MLWSLQRIFDLSHKVDIKLHFLAAVLLDGSAITCNVVALVTCHWTAFYLQFKKR